MAGQRFCTECGNPLAADSQFCGVCGAAVAPAGPDAASAPPPPRAPRRRIWPAAVAGIGMLVAVGAILLSLEDRPHGTRDTPATTADRPVSTTAKSDRAPAPEQESGLPSDLGWQTYSNARYGVAVDYPGALFSMRGDEPADHSGRGFEAADGGWFFVYSSANALEQNIDQLLADAVENAGSANVVSNEARADGLDIVLRREGQIVRQHLLTSDQGGFLHWLQMGWPEAGEAAMAPVAERMIASFRVDPSVSPETGAEADAGQEPEHGPDEFTYRSVKSRDFGFAVEGASVGGGFTVEIPDWWVREEASGKAGELVFKDPDADVDTGMFLAFIGEQAAGRSAGDVADAHATELQTIGGAEIVTREETSVGPFPAVRVRLRVVSPSDIDTMLMDEFVVLQMDGLLYSVELTAPEPIWHTAGQAIDHALATIAFEQQ